jgi:hypothetical protein
MPIVLFLGRDVKEYENKSAEIIKLCIDSGNIRCKICLCTMAKHSKYERGIKGTGAQITIIVVWCSKCKKWHALLPDFLLPYKHYSGNEIESVIIDSAEEPVDHIQTEASEATVRRWIKQIGARVTQAISILKYLFRRAGQAVSEVAIDTGPGYSELEQILEMAPSFVKFSGNKLGLANIWLGTNAMAVYI